MATHAVTAEGATGSVSSATRPYPPSWLDAIVRGIERLPGPTWVAYVGLFVFAVAFIALEAALSSRGLFGQDLLYFGYAIFHVYVLAAYHLLSRRALSAWDTFRPATGFSEAQAERLKAELSTTPARPAIVIYLVGAALYLALLASSPAGFDLTGHPPAFVALRVLSEAFWLAPVSWMVAYLLYRQLRIVAQLHRSVVSVDLLKTRPLHALSKLTATTAIVLLVAQLSFVLVPLPNLTETARLTLAAVFVPFAGLALAAFFLPLRGMRALLEAEKGRRLDEASDRIDATVATLHRVVDEETASARDAEQSRLAQLRVDALSKALTGLLQERDFTARISTWPWETSTLGAVLSAVALPIVLFLVTRFLERFIA